MAAVAQSVAYSPHNLHVHGSNPGLVTCINNVNQHHSCRKHVVNSGKSRNGQRKGKDKGKTRGRRRSKGGGGEGSNCKNLLFVSVSWIFLLLP